MGAEIQRIYEELALIKKDLDFIKNVLAEEFELSNSAKKALEEARKTPESDYIEL